jgi:hypothetical protein
MRRPWPTGDVSPKTNKQRAVLMKVRLPGCNAMSLGGQFPTFLPDVSKDRIAFTFSVKQSKKNQRTYLLAVLHGARSCSTVVQVVVKPAVSSGIRSYITVFTGCCPSPRICVRCDGMLVFYDEELLNF